MARLNPHTMRRSVSYAFLSCTQQNLDWFQQLLLQGFFGTFVTLQRLKRSKRSRVAEVTESAG